MDSSDSLMWMVTTIAYHLPYLIACAIGLVLLSTSARPGVARQRGAIGLGLMVGCALVQLALGLYQNWMLQRAGAGLTSVRAQIAVLSGLNLLLNVVAAGGLVLLVTGLCRATRDAEAAATSSSSPPALPTDVLPPT